MVEGDKWEILYIPSELGYGDKREPAQDPRRRAARLPDGDFEH